eukprot:Protomagalhaensia_wolfi_Nauph_80__1954@NODE_2233_length_1159_cov_7_241964_g1743_i0_p1_GENE_NODE_2233_length_1159_cov_7_241964_g1743_i0NODE_2233_length_1159_cov_7_241964_g1743_i0_p1_ORF_typecomplete_len352_score26_65_NODE_2233_length_1159_cov_7_241964_g1743_i0461101
MAEVEELEDPRNPRLRTRVSPWSLPSILEGEASTAQLLPLDEQQVSPPPSLEVASQLPKLRASSEMLLLHRLRRFRRQAARPVHHAMESPVFGGLITAPKGEKFIVTVAADETGGNPQTSSAPPPSRSRWCWGRRGTGLSPTPGHSRLYVQVTALGEGCGVLGALEGDASLAPRSIVPATRFPLIRMGVMPAEHSNLSSHQKQKRKGSWWKTSDSATPSTNTTGSPYCCVFAHDRSAVCLLQIEVDRAWQLAATSGWLEQGLPLPKDAVRIRMLYDGRKQPVLFDPSTRSVGRNAIPRKRTSLAQLFARNRNSPTTARLDTQAHVESWFLSEVATWPAPQSCRVVTLFKPF